MEHSGTMRLTRHSRARARIISGLPIALPFRRAHLLRRRLKLVRIRYEIHIVVVVAIVLLIMDTLLTLKKVKTTFAKLANFCSDRIDSRCQDFIFSPQLAMLF